MPFGDVLRAHMSRPPGYSPGLVSRLSGVPKATIVNWLTGRVARPRRWQDLVRVADAMRLGHGEVDELLAAASQPSLVELARVIDDDGRVLLEPWVSSASFADPVEGPLGCVGRAFASRVRGGDGEAGPTLRRARDVEPQAVSVDAHADVVTGDEAEVVGGSSVSVHAPVVPARTEPPDRELALQPGRSCLRFDEADQERATVQRKQAVPRVDALSVDADDGPERRTGRGAVPRDRRRADPPRSSSISVKQRPHRRLCVERVRAPPVDLPVGSDERCSCALAEDAMRSERRAV